MPVKKADRRIERTRQMLHEALVSLILEKGYLDITIQDILDRANVGRSTFYAHFRDKEDLLLSGFNRLVEEFQVEYPQIADRPADPVRAMEDFTLVAFRHAQSHHLLFKAMVGKQGGNIIFEDAQKYLSQIIKKYISTLALDPPLQVPIDLLVSYLVSSFLAVLVWWLDHDMPFSAEQINAIFTQLVAPGIRSMLNTSAEPQ